MALAVALSFEKAGHRPLVLATTPGYFWHARLVLADMMVAAFIVWSAWAFWREPGSAKALDVRTWSLILAWIDGTLRAVKNLPQVSR